MRLQAVPTQTVAFWTHLAQTIPAQMRFNRIENCWKAGLDIDRFETVDVATEEEAAATAVRLAATARCKA